MLRCDAIGIDVQRVQWVAFVAAGLFAGLAGALFAFSKGSISPDSLAVGRSVDGLVMVLLGGLQTLSGQCANMAHHLPALREAGVAGLRLSPQTSGFFEVIELFAHLTAGRIDAEEFCARALPHAPGGAFCDGFLDGPTGVSWSGSQDQVRMQPAGTP